MSGRRSSWQRSSARRNVGWVSNRLRPMPTYCEPWPLKRNATSGARAPFTCSCTTPAGVVPATTAASASRNSATLAVGTARRWAKWERPVLAVKHTSASCESSVRARRSAMRPASVRRPSAVRVEIVSTCRGRSSAAGNWMASASSRTAWAFVPLKPKEFTPAIRGPPLVVHGVSSVGTRTLSWSHGMYGFSRVTCGWGGISRCCIASTSLMIPAMPAAASRWPMFAFTAPMSSGWSGFR